MSTKQNIFPEYKSLKFEERTKRMAKSLSVHRLQKNLANSYINCFSIMLSAHSYVECSSLNVVMVSYQKHFAQFIIWIGRKECSLTFVSDDTKSELRTPKKSKSYINKMFAHGKRSELF